ncbi:MAG: CPBP family intramembrane metalloprotease [Bacteroidales bacterium]|jgi:hypothetical protein|nr:CPBP family intramembrane metalloprotease [Bacteroidales bacterium]
MIRQLKFLVQDFLTFFRKDFHIAAYLYVFIIVGTFIGLIYGTEWGEQITYSRIPTPFPILNNILMYLLIYFLVAIPVACIKKETGKLRNPLFYIKAILITSLIGFADAFSWREVLQLPSLTAEEQNYIFRTLWRMRNAVFVIPVLVLLRLFIDKNVKGLYGLCSGNHHVKAYLYLYVVILPVLIIVSFTPDFLSYYPSYKPWNYENAFGNPVWLNTLIFETVYMSDFLMVELIFRGALVIGMVSLMGRNAVLPMIAVYVALHFGKPVLETISAFFGGYFLGALAFQTRHIWGGVIIHMGIALIIELLRFFQHYVLGIG